MSSRLKTLLNTFRAPSTKPSSDKTTDYQCFADLRVDGALAQASPNAGLEIDGVCFPRLAFTPRRNTLIGASADHTKIVKIEFERNPRKRNDILEESRLMQVLHERGSRTSPAIYSTGRVSISDHRFPNEVTQRARQASIGDVGYSIRQAIPTAPWAPIADPLLALLEQKSLGIFNGDFKPANFRFDPASGVAFIVDFDQAVEIDAGTRALGNREFLAWCDRQDQEAYARGSMWRHFPGLEYEKHVAPLFRDDAFDLGQTMLGRRQNTTRAEGGIYHQLDDPRIFTRGVRDFAERSNVLERLFWQPNERVLDVGCNLGLLSFWLADRACTVTGIDLDPSIIELARIAANVMGKNVRFEAIDLDDAALPGAFDTVMLFSVLHHTRDVPASAAKVAAACRRIVIECRLEENGSKPEGGAWRRTSAWSHKTVDSLVAMLEGYFPGFKLRENHGPVDKGRYLLEFRR